MRFRRLFPLFFGIASGLLPLLLAAQVKPVTAPFWLTATVNAEAEPDRPDWEYWSYVPRAVPLAGGGFVAVWESEQSECPSLDCRSFFISARKLSASGKLSREILLDRGRLWDDVPEKPTVAADGVGGFVTVWCFGGDLLVESFGPDGAYRTDWTLNEYTADGQSWGRNAEVAANAAGEVAIAWEFWTAGGRHTELAARVFHADGTPATPRIAIAPTDPGRDDFTDPLVGIDGHGRFVLVWSEKAGLQGQRFNRDGSPLGRRFRVTDTPAHPVSPERAVPRLAMAPDGSFTVASGGSPLRVRAYTPAATPLVPTLTIDGWLQDLAADSHGNLVLSYWDGKRQRIRLFNRRLVPQGPVLTAPASALALADSGRLLTIWKGRSVQWPSGAWQTPLLAKLWQVP